MPHPSQRPEEELHVNENYRILFEDPAFIIAEKPAPLPVHKVGRFVNKNLLSLLIREGYGNDLSVVNRLDSETSGIVILARSSEIAGKLGIQFQNREVEKKYQAVVFGHFLEAKGSVRLPISAKLERGYYFRQADQEGKPSETSYEVLEQRKGFSLVELTPLTGRTHQLRVHMAAIQHPLVGDKIYLDGTIFMAYRDLGWQDWMLETVKLSRLALHATQIKIRHPLTGEPLEIHSPLAQEIQDFWNSLTNK